MDTLPSRNGTEVSNHCVYFITSQLKILLLIGCYVKYVLDIKEIKCYVMEFSTYHQDMLHTSQQ